MEASGSSSGAVARLQVTEAQDIEEVAVVKQEQGHYLETTGEENYEENYDANYYDDPGMMEYDSSQNIINSKGERHTNHEYTGEWSLNRRIKTLFGTN